MTTFKLGQAVPNFTLPSTAGDQFSLEQARDGLQLIIFFRGSWCPVCVEVLNDYEKNISNFTDNNVDVVAVSTDSLENLMDMKEKHGFSFPLLSDEKRNALDRFGVFYHGEDSPYEDHGIHGEPAYFLLDNQGRLMYQQKQTGPFGRPDAEALRKTIRYIQKNLK